MGVIAPHPLVVDAVADDIRNNIINPIMRGLKEEGLGYTEFLFFGVMMTADGAEHRAVPSWLRKVSPDIIRPGLVSKESPMPNAPEAGCIFADVIDDAQGCLVTSATAWARCGYACRCER